MRDRPGRAQEDEDAVRRATILSIQRDAVSLARRGLVSTKEKEVLLEEVLEDLEEVFKLEEGRSHEQGAHGGEHWARRRRALGRRRSHDARRKTSRLTSARGRRTRRESASELANVRHERRLRVRARAHRRHATHPGFAHVREAAGGCGAHIASTRRRMDRASTAAPSSRASTVETIETQDSTTEAH